MKYILILFIVLIFFSKIKAIKVLFKSDKEVRKEWSNIRNKIKQESDVYDGESLLMVVGLIVGIVLGLTYMIFYTLSMIYIGYLWFAIISAFQIVFTIKSTLGYMGEIHKFREDDYIAKKKIFKTIVNVLIEFAYMGYVLYFMIVNWN